MIKLPKNFFRDLSPAQYKEQLKLLPNLNDEKTKLYTMLAFTLAALSFFGIFAINPTLSTIAELKRQFADLQFVYEKLITKTQNLSALQQKYQTFGDDLTIVFDAMPKQPEVPKFIAQVNALLVRSNLKVNSLQTFGVEITPDKKIEGLSPAFFVFSLEAEGSYDDIILFTKNLTQINRLVIVDTISVDKDDKRGVLMVNLRGRQYFKP